MSFALNYDWEKGRRDLIAAREKVWLVRIFRHLAIR